MRVYSPNGKCSYLFLLFVLLLAGCDKPPYDVIDTGYIASDDIYWLDNDRVLFVGSFGSYEEVSNSILIWDWNKGLEVYKKAPSGLGKLCYFNGTIRYAVDIPHEDGHRKWMEGPVGEEHLVNVDEEPGGKKQFSWIDCRFVKEPTGLAGRFWMPLAEGHGYLDRGPIRISGEERLHTSFRLYSDRFPDGKLLPFTNKTANNVRYYQFRSAYFLWGFHGTTWQEWKDAGCTQAWWLSLDGEVEEDCVPFVYLGEQTKPFIYPTKSGYVLAGGSPGTKSGKNTQGAYYLSGNKVVKLVSGLAGKPAVSPSGCRVAFPIMPSTKYPGARRSLKLVDLCNPTKEE